MTELLTVENLTIKSATQTLVDSLSYTLHTGETLAIVGESGSGKSISSLALLGLLPNSLSITGQAYLTDSQTDQAISLPIEKNSLSKDGQNIFRQIRGKRIGMIFQEPMTALNPLHTVGKQIAESLSLAGVAKKHWRQRTLALLSQVNIANPESKLARYPHELSGGQRQRVAIARALAPEPELILADEPTASLDSRSGQDVVELLGHLSRKRGSAVLLVTHDLRLLKDADRIWAIEDGSIHPWDDSKKNSANQH